MDYLTVSGFSEFEQVVKGSRFIGWVAPLDSEEEAQELLSLARREHPDATHHCSAWRFGELVRFSDDGEPGGTAGRPMLEVLLRRDLQQVAAIVIRYFGGTRLGAGGLVRAYSGTVARTLDQAGTRLVLEQAELGVLVPFALVDTVLRFMADEPNLSTLASEYVVDGLELRLQMPVGQLTGFRDRLQDHTSGQVDLIDRNSG